MYYIPFQDEKYNQPAFSLIISIVLEGLAVVLSTLALDSRGGVVHALSDERIEEILFPFLPHIT